MTITIYTISNSPFCTQAKDYLTAKNLAFEELDVEHNKDNLNEMLTVSDHFTGVPYVHVVMDDNSEAGLKGFTKDEFDDVFASVAPQNATLVPEVIPLDQPLQPQNASLQDSQTPIEIHDTSDTKETSLHDEDDEPLYPSHTEPVPVAPTPQASQTDYDHNTAVEVDKNPTDVVPTGTSSQPIPPVAQPEELGSVMKNLMQQSGQPLPPTDASNNDMRTPSPQFGGSELKQSTTQSEEPKNIPEENTNAQQTNSQPSIPDFPK